MDSFYEALDFVYTNVTIEPRISTEVQDDESNDLSADTIARIVVGVIALVSLSIAVVLTVAIIYIAKGARGKEKMREDKTESEEKGGTSDEQEMEMSPSQAAE